MKKFSETKALLNVYLQVFVNFLEVLIRFTNQKTTITLHDGIFEIR